MSKKKKHNKKQRATSKTTLQPVETRVSESLTVFWVVTVLTVMLTNLLAIAAHFFQLANPASERLELLKGLMLFAGSLIGLASLVVLPIIYRVRRTPPPSGFAVFGACAAVAPILAMAVRMFQ